MPAPWSAEWKGLLLIDETGTYGFALESDDALALEERLESVPRAELGTDRGDATFALGDRVRHVHLKDVARVASPEGRRGWVPRLPGRGEFDPARVLSALRARRYDRWVSFEWEKRWHPALEEPEVAPVIDLMDALRKSVADAKKRKAEPEKAKAAPKRAAASSRKKVAAKKR